MSAYFYYAALLTYSPYFPAEKQTLNIKNVDFSPVCLRRTNRNRAGSFKALDSFLSLTFSTSSSKL